MGAIALILLLNLATARELTCDDFPEEKEEDCLEIKEQGLSEDDEQAVLELLLDDSEDDSDYVWEFDEYEGVGLRLLTNKLTYKTGAEIEVDILPKNIVVRLTYGQNTINTINRASFVADPLYNKIKVEYRDETYSRRINVIETNRLLLALNIFVLGFVNYFVFSIVTKSSNIKKWLNVASST